MKKLNWLGVVFVISLVSSAHAVRSGQNGNGGGGIQRDGRYMTFYSAGFFTELQEEALEEIPQLNSALHFFNTTLFLSPQTKAKFSSSLYPSSFRKYYKVKAEEFTQEVRDRLVAEYSRVMKIESQELAIFAITDTQSKTTYLFPEFYNLTWSEQQAILFHEAFWIAYPKSTYKQVIDAEINFQAFLENPDSPEKLLRFIRSSASRYDAFLAAINFDLKSKAMGRLVSRNNTILIKDLLGPQFLDCRMRFEAKGCRSFVDSHVYYLTSTYPKSLFLKLFMESVANNLLQLYLEGGGDSLFTISFRRHSHANYFAKLSNTYFDLETYHLWGSNKVLISMPDPLVGYEIEF